ncbi:unnamed protein product [Urochloa decumbens]|uniref:Uncharacterized protein n=1 Tax=Urochloa decumbens TaxID=240449 RepID=A0ABC9C4C5_9POAL
MAAAAPGIPLPPASLARTAAAAAVIFLWLASMRLAFAAAAATEIGRVTYGDGSLVVAAASKVPALETESTAEVIAEAMREMLHSTLIRGVLIAAVFIQLTFLVDLVGSRVKGSHWGRICSVVRIIGVLGADAMYCFVVVPTIARLWWKKQPLM